MNLGKVIRVRPKLSSFLWYSEDPLYNRVYAIKRNFQHDGLLSVACAHGIVEDYAKQYIK